MTDTKGRSPQLAGSAPFPPVPGRWRRWALPIMIAPGIAAWVAIGRVDSPARLGDRAPDPGPASGPRGAPTSTDARRLVGSWVRLDGGYLLTIASVTDGKVVARYNNPRPIHVATAELRTEGGGLGLYLELRDQNYPGNFYTLSYDAGADRLVGLYHQLGVGQKFDVSFERFAGSARQ